MFFFYCKTGLPDWPYSDIIQQQQKNDKHKYIDMWKNNNKKKIQLQTFYTNLSFN